eukprot:CAMPEP_0115584126 /NCGR_PEP_ID=MMETSP0272-20121206/6523_1 /TAXON_ID=71861 /ORGANISM="Scrippsiella trochoidea, Strain CCMP3099" /LENGTH=35 /DNA_ID= /DNA_START= /DNA_END= /DNA_ORIENTATION=
MDVVTLALGDKVGCEGDSPLLKTTSPVDNKTVDIA